MAFPSDYLRIRESTFFSDKVKRDIKIVSIGDIHLSKLVTLDQVDRILKAIESVKPDYICILGDIVDTPLEISYENRLVELEVLIKCCNNIANTFVIIGNHDFYYDKDSKTTTIHHIWDKYDELENIHVLKDKTYTDDNIFVGGYMQKGEAYHGNNNQEDEMSFYNDLSYRNELINKLPTDKYKIFLTHSPEPIHSRMNQELLRDYNLILAGHYHNGVVPPILESIVPKNQGLLTPRRTILPSEARGIVKLKTGTYLIYNGGWTKIPATAKDFMCSFDKFFNRDIDVTTITNDYEYFDSSVKTKKLKI